MNFAVPVGYCGSMPCCVVMRRVPCYGCALCVSWRHETQNAHPQQDTLRNTTQHDMLPKNQLEL